MNKDNYADNDNLKNKCFCDYCDDFVDTSECYSININDDFGDFEVACKECMDNLYINTIFRK